MEVESLVDMDATFPTLPEDKVVELGLLIIGEYPAETAGGTVEVVLAAHAIIKIEDRILKPFVPGCSLQSFYIFMVAPRDFLLAHPLTGSTATSRAGS